MSVIGGGVVATTTSEAKGVEISEPRRNEFRGETDSAGIDYRRPEIGSVRRSVQQKLMDTVSPEDFGAIGDGNHLDTQAIQSALDTGLDVQLGPKTYLTGKLYLRAAQKIRGRSIWKTQLKAAPNLPKGYLVNLGNDDVYAAGLYDLTVNANAAQQSNSLGCIGFDNKNGKNFPFYDPKHSVSRVYLVNSNYIGLMLSANARGSSVTEVYVQQCQVAGFDIACTDSFFEDIVCGACGVGFKANGANNRCIALKAFGCQLGFEILGFRDAFVCCEAQDNRSDGFRMTSTARHVTLTSSLADSNGEYGFSINSSINIQLISVKSISRAGVPFVQKAAFHWSNAKNCILIGEASDNQKVHEGDFSGNQVNLSPANYWTNDASGRLSLQGRNGGGWIFDDNLGIPSILFGENGVSISAKEDSFVVNGVLQIKNGVRVMSGKGLPSDDLGSEGDLYVDALPKKSEFMYRKINSKWVVVL